MWGAECASHDLMEASQSAAANEAERRRGQPAPTRNGRHGNDDGNEAIHGGEATLGLRWREIVKERPLLAVTGAATIGAALGGFVFSRVGRLAFLAVAGYAAHELWHSERRIEIDELISKLSSPRRPMT